MSTVLSMISISGIHFGKNSAFLQTVLAYKHVESEMASAETHPKKAYRNGFKSNVSSMAFFGGAILMSLSSFCTSCEQGSWLPLSRLTSQGCVRSELTWRIGTVSCSIQDQACLRPIIKDLGSLNPGFFLVMHLQLFASPCGKGGWESRHKKMLATASAVRV